MLYGYNFPLTPCLDVCSMTNFCKLRLSARCQMSANTVTRSRSPNIPSETSLAISFRPSWYTPWALPGQSGNLKNVNVSAQFPTDCSMQVKSAPIKSDRHSLVSCPSLKSEIGEFSVCLSSSYPVSCLSRLNAIKKAT